MEYLGDIFKAALEEKNYILNDGGREAAGFKGSAGDCAARAMAIALQKDYKECYQELAEAHKERTGKKTAREGIYKDTMTKVLKGHGWHWHPAPNIRGRKAKHYDMPKGRVIARMARHYSAIIDGSIHDTWDCSNKMIYGYWMEV